MLSSRWTLKNPPASLNPRSENIWVGLQVTECTSSSVSVSVGTVDIDFFLSLWLYIPDSLLSQPVVAECGSPFWPQRRALHPLLLWDFEKATVPTQTCWLFVYRCLLKGLQTWTNSFLTDWKTSARLPTATVSQCHPLSGSSRWLHMQLSFQEEFFLMMLIISFYSVLYWFLFHIQESVNTHGQRWLTDKTKGTLYLTVEVSWGWQSSQGE